MSHKSPYKVLRNVKRITKFMEKKAADKKIMTVRKLPELDIPPAVKILTFTKPTIISIMPTLRHLSSSKPVLIDIPPEFPRPKPIYSSNPLIMKISRLQNCSSTSTQPTPAAVKIPQLDGISITDPEVLQCKVCKKMLETADDVKWHYETQIGREDCSILKSMLGWNPP